jgi:peptide deformylase
VASTMMDRMAGVRGVLVQGAPADGFGQFAPEAGRGRVRRITEVGEAVLGRRCRTV